MLSGVYWARSCLLPADEDVVSVLLSTGHIPEGLMLVNSSVNASTQIVSGSSSWGGMSRRPKGQWLSEAWDVFSALAESHLQSAASSCAL